MTATALPLSQEKTGWRWEQWLDKAREFYRNVVWLQEIRRRDDDIIPRSPLQKWAPFWKKKPTLDLDAMDIDQISLSSYERRHLMKENRCFTCHEPGYTPWKYQRGSKEAKTTGKAGWQPPDLPWTNHAIPTTSKQSITILVELYYSEMDAFPKPTC